MKTSMTIQAITSIRNYLITGGDADLIMRIDQIILSDSRLKTKLIQLNEELKKDHASRLENRN